MTNRTGNLYVNPVTPMDLIQAGHDLLGAQRDREPDGGHARVAEGTGHRRGRVAEVRRGRDAH